MPASHFESPEEMESDHAIMDEIAREYCKKKGLPEIGFWCPKAYERFSREQAAKAKGKKGASASAGESQPTK